MRLFSLFALVAGLVAAVPARAQVTASLVSADGSVQPGHPLTLAVRMVHKEHWHSYWIYPGTGLPTTIDWKLPTGWTAGPIQWPTPGLLDDGRGNIIGNGYEGDLLLPVTLTPPAGLTPGQTVTFTAKVDWLMCREECVPGNAELTLTLPVGAESPKPDPTFGPRIAAVQAVAPRSIPGWTVTATKDAKTATLVLEQQADGPAPAHLHFFSEDGTIAFDQPQTVTTQGKTTTLVLPIGTDGPTPLPKTLVGVLRSDTSWVGGADQKGFRIEAAFGEKGAAPAAPLPSAAAPSAPSAGAGAASPPPAAPPGGFAFTLLLALVGGLILNLMPCVFPVIGIKILGFVRHAGSDRATVTKHGLVYTAGVLLSFWVLAGLREILHAAGNQLGWGYQLQWAPFNFMLASVMLIFAMNLSGVFEFGLSATSVGSGLQTKEGLPGTFFSGILATVVATPCSAPFLGAALSATISLSTAQSFAIFTTIAIGLSLPYLVLSAFPSAVKVLPRPGAWMETFKQLMAFPLYGTVGYLIWVLTGQTEAPELLSVLFGLTLVALAIWIYGRFRSPGASAGRARFGLIGGLAVLALGAWIGWPQQLESKPAPNAIVWEAWSPDKVAQAHREGKIVYVDFTARWCFTCQVNKKVVFHSEDVLKAFRDKKVVTLRGDWTNRDSQITAELAKYGRTAVPFNQVWLPGRDQPVLLPEVLSPSTVLKAVNAD